MDQEEVGQAGRQAELVDRLADLARFAGLDPFDPEQEPRGGEHGDHRLADPVLDRLARLGVGRLGDDREPIQDLLVDRTPERPRGKALEDVAGVGTPGLGRAGVVLGEESLPVLRPGPVLRLGRPFESGGNASDIELCGLDRRLLDQRADLEAQAVIAGAEGLVELVVELLIVAPAILLGHEHAVIDGEDDAALARLGVEVAVDDHVDRQPIVAVVIGLHLGRDLRLVIEAQPLASQAARTPEVRPVEDATGHALAHRGHRLGDDRLGRLDVFFEQQRGYAQDVTDVVEAVTRVVGGEFFIGAEVDPHQVADRVAILDAVQPSQGDAARVGIIGIGPEGVPLDPVLQRLDLIGRRPGLARWRHQARADVLEDRMPQVSRSHGGIVVGELVERDVPLLRPQAVTAVAVLFEDRLDGLAIPRRGILVGASVSRDGCHGREDGDMQP